MKELDLYRPLIRASSLRYEVFAYEVPVADYMQSRKRIDIVLLDEKRMLTAIEVKIRDWKSAIKQAFANLFASDFSYVALWHDYAENADIDMFAKTGIGLISVSRNRCMILTEANKSQFTIGRKHYYLMSRCLEVTYHNDARLIHPLKPHSRSKLVRGFQRPAIYNSPPCSHP